MWFGRRLLCLFVLVGLALYFLTSRTQFVVDIAPPLEQAKQPILHQSTKKEFEHPSNPPVGLVSANDESGCVPMALHRNFSSFGSVALCYNSAKCNGHIAIRMNRCSLPTRKLSHNVTYNRWLIDVAGPDLFRLHIDGLETHATMSAMVKPPPADGSAGACEYAIPIPPLQHSGSYSVGLEWLYGDYAALDEASNVWPYLMKVPVLPLKDAFTTSYHLGQCTLPSDVTLACAHDRYSEDQRQLLPSCIGLSAVTSGRWVVDTGDVATRVRVKKIQRNPIVFEWAIQTDVSRHWVPDKCNMRNFSSKTVTDALRSKRILIGGDSQLRALYFGLVNYLAGFNQECIRKLVSTAREPAHCHPNVKGSHRKLINTVQVDFVDDLFLDRLGDRYKGYDAIVVGMAQHPASKEHWSFDRYRGAVSSKLANLNRLGASHGSVIVWYMAPQYPHSRNGFPVAVKDWRTDARLRMFNDYAKTECLRGDPNTGLAPIPVVDGFRISSAMSHTSPDQAHFTNFVSTELVLMTLNVICARIGPC